MKTSELSNTVTENILRKLPKTARLSVQIRASSVNVKNGRCSFPFHVDDTTKVLVGVVCRAGKPTGQYYVIPAGITPKKLELKPADRASKWHVFMCGLGDLSEAVKKASVWAQPAEITKLLS